MIDEHSRFEGRDDVQGVLDTLSDDVVGSPDAEPAGATPAHRNARA